MGILSRDYGMYVIFDPHNFQKNADQYKAELAMNCN